jgi:UDP-N-acetylmuramate dehydrogenase
MSGHTTFQTGGPADLWIRPAGDCFPDYGAALLRFAQARGIPVFILGGGANLVVADAGIRGIALDTGGYTGALFPQDAGGGLPRVLVKAGTPMDALVDEAAERGWSGLEFLAGMPGTVGGAVWMNARCMEQSMSGVLEAAVILDEERRRVTVPLGPADFSYKKSPFQDRDALILAAVLRARPGSPERIRAEAARLRQDREQKGHYRAPSAGSVFKNNRAFGAPAGKIIDELGLRGLAIGGAMVAPWHGNFIINTGNAASADIRALTEALRERVHAARGIRLEPEIRFVGAW